MRREPHLLPTHTGEHQHPEHRSFVWLQQPLRIPPTFPVTVRELQSAQHGNVVATNRDVSALAVPDRLKMRTLLAAVLSTLVLAQEEPRTPACRNPGKSFGGLEFVVARLHGSL